MYRNALCKDLKDFKSNIAMVSYSLVKKEEYDRVVELVWSFFRSYDLLS